jgi:hypothetical protein
MGVPSWAKAPLRKLAKWIVQHGKEELEKEIERRTGASDPVEPPPYRTPNERSGGL